MPGRKTRDEHRSVTGLDSFCYRTGKGSVSSSWHVSVTGMFCMPVDVV